MVRSQPAHIRGNRIVGDLRQISMKAIKVLATIKFSPNSLTREEIMQKNGLSTRDATQQVKLLMSYNLIKSHTRFPPFPREGWRVYTEKDQHMKVIKLLKHYGIEPPQNAQTREILGDYFPTGMELEGRGRQTNQGHNYPTGVPIIEELEFRPETLRLMQKWKTEIYPYRPQEFSQEAIKKRLEKMQWCADRLAKIYRIPIPRIKAGTFTEQSWYERKSSGSSNYNRSTHTITLNGKFSVGTFLHEFGHARGFDERDTVIWSTNLFKRAFPGLYAKLDTSGHTLVTRDRDTSFSL